MSEQFFSIRHPLAVNLIPLPEDFVLPGLPELETELPEPFRISNAIAQLDASSLRALRGLGDELHPLVEVINQQSRKINMLMGFVLAQQDDPSLRHHTRSFGGGGLTVLTDLPLQLGQLLRLKIFLPDEAAAVYCYGRISAFVEEDGEHLAQVSYAQIREEDRELLVRASLHIQSKQLKQRAELRARQ